MKKIFKGLSHNFLVFTEQFSPSRLVRESPKENDPRQCEAISRSFDLMEGLEQPQTKREDVLPATDALKAKALTEMEQANEGLDRIMKMYDQWRRQFAFDEEDADYLKRRHEGEWTNAIEYDDEAKEFIGKLDVLTYGFERDSPICHAEIKQIMQKAIDAIDVNAETNSQFPEIAKKRRIEILLKAYEEAEPKIARFNENVAAIKKARTIYDRYAYGNAAVESAWKEAQKELYRIQDEVADGPAVAEQNKACIAKFDDEVSSILPPPALYSSLPKKNLL